MHIPGKGKGLTHASARASAPHAPPLASGCTLHTYGMLRVCTHSNVAVGCRDQSGRRSLFTSVTRESSYHPTHVGPPIRTHFPGF